MTRLGNRIRKLETSQRKFKTMEFIASETGGDFDKLSLERFGADGPPVGVELYRVITGVPRCR
jgi:hypothetical protein